MVLILVFVFFPINCSLSQVNEELSIRVKAAFVLNFLRLTTFPNQPTSFKICIDDLDGYGEIYKELANEKVNSTSIEISSIQTESNLHRCNVFLVSDRSTGVLAKIRSLGTSSLIVGDGEDILNEGGIIRMFEEGGKIRFSVHLGNAEGLGIKISSKMLGLAKEVKR